MIACCLFAAKGYGQEPAKDENPNAPEITFTETVHDFGTIPLNGEAEYEFTFTNTGKEPLIIQRCNAGCSCTVPACPTDKPVKPGEKGTIKVKYTTTQVPGAFNKQFTVTSNAKNSIVRLTIKGVIAKETETAAK
jgi:hypothetical protein